MKIQYRLEEMLNKIKYGFTKIRYQKNLKREEEYWEIAQKQITQNGKDYYVIRRKGKVGLFSIYITTVAQIKYAIDKGIVPIVDLKNYRNVYMGIECLGEYNPWEKMFIQPSNEHLSDVEKSAGTLHYCDMDIPDDRPTDETDFLYSLNDENNEWRQVVKNYIKISPRILEDVTRLFKGFCSDGSDKVLGVLCRGTDYVKLKPKDHPVQPDIEELFTKIDEVRSKYSCNKIFVATEDSSYENAFRNKYGASLCTIQEEKVEYENGYLSDVYKVQTQEERMLTGINYLKKILLLSMCQCFVAGRTSGTVGVMLQDHNFEYTYFFDKGRY